mmetsp:Transcript_10932/g.29316  ORF Transcript_10932/g.29316 Transcript_10932/m.29316 type:complete len:438 (+) Transcript_10932:44-1357(+)
MGEGSSVAGHGGVLDEAAEVRVSSSHACVSARAARPRTVVLDGARIEVCKPARAGWALRRLASRTESDRGRRHEAVVGAEGERAAYKVLWRDSVLDARIDFDKAQSTVHLEFASGRSAKLRFQDKLEYERWLEVLEVARAYEFSRHYELGSLIGAGAFADVRTCRERASGAIFAAKRIQLRSSAAQEPHALELMRREVSISLDLHHENIVELCDVFLEDTCVFLVQEYARGGTLRDYLNKGLSNELLRSVFRQILRGVRYMHRKGVIHRDLKLANVLLMESDLEHRGTDISLLERQDVVKIADLGLASAGAQAAVFHSVVGSPRYCAPEVLAGHGYTFSADMWSVGVMLYALLSCGQYPVVGADSREILARTKSGKLQPMEGDHWFGVDHSAKDLVSKLLVMNPRVRLSAEEALEHEWLSGSSELSSSSTFHFSHRG